MHIGTAILFIIILGVILLCLVVALGYAVKDDVLLDRYRKREAKLVKQINEQGREDKRKELEQVQFLIKEIHDRRMEGAIEKAADDIDFNMWRKEEEQKQGYRFHNRWFARSAYLQERNVKYDFRTGEPNYKE